MKSSRSDCESVPDDEDEDDDMMDHEEPQQQHHRHSKHSYFWCSFRSIGTIISVSLFIAFVSWILTTSDSSSTKAKKTNSSNDDNKNNNESGNDNDNNAADINNNVDFDLDLDSCGFRCQTHHPDRIGHDVPLYPGQAVCNVNYRFGVTTQGTLVWKDCDSGETIVLVETDVLLLNTTTTLEEGMGGEHQNDEDNNDNTNILSNLLYWKMSPTATFQFFVNTNDDTTTSITISPSSSYTLLWELPSNRQDSMKVTFHCLKNPELDCPYLHLHKSGDVVLNWIDRNTGKWMARNIKRCYDDLF